MKKGKRSFLKESHFNLVSYRVFEIEVWKMKQIQDSSNFKLRFGKSINFIDASTGKWKQVWIGSNGPGISEFVNGSYHDGAMRFEFEENTPQGSKQLVSFFTGIGLKVYVQIISKGNAKSHLFRGISSHQFMTACNWQFNMHDKVF